MFARRYRITRTLCAILASGTLLSGCLGGLGDGATALRFRNGFANGLADGLVAALEGDEPLADVLSQFAAAMFQGFAAAITPRNDFQPGQTSGS